ncbi:MAG: 50S ribosomal protein L35 [Elusimicrobia bacterium CG08_land_8_20_14_0_20_51_18]|nr:MAG: 50S ribosomal protein L35 [Elusimicrobia bacterium CG08_land_8_20_14_0_20_51_18]
MPKIKSHSGAKKRFKKTKTGKWTHRKAGLRHLLTGMKPARGRHLRTAKVIGATEDNAKILKRYLPYE